MYKHIVCGRNTINFLEMLKWNFVQIVYLCYFLSDFMTSETLKMQWTPWTVAGWMAVSWECRWLAMDVLRLRHTDAAARGESWVLSRYSNSSSLIKKIKRYVDAFRNCAFTFVVPVSTFLWVEYSYLKQLREDYLLWWNDLGAHSLFEIRYRYRCKADEGRLVTPIQMWGVEMCKNCVHCVGECRRKGCKWWKEFNMAAARKKRAFKEWLQTSLRMAQGSYREKKYRFLAILVLFTMLVGLCYIFMFVFKNRLMFFSWTIFSHSVRYVASFVSTSKVEINCPSPRTALNELQHELQ